VRLKIGKKYKISAKIKGSKVREGLLRVFYRGRKKLGEKKVTRGSRGSAKVDTNTIEEKEFEEIRLNPGNDWTNVEKTFTVKFDEHKELNSEETTSWTSIQFSFLLQPGQGEIYFDDVRLVEVP
ncbi:MAG: hypothetical protein ACK5NG_03435, partial [Chthoniobacterales bacterium]